MSAPEPLITMAQVAELLGMPVKSIYKWRTHGRGPKGYRIGKHVKFRASEVEAWLQDQREQEPNQLRLVANTRTHRT